MRKSTIVVLAVAALALGSNAVLSRPIDERPKAMVQRLYKLVVARRPLGSADGFSPYLSKKLAHEIGLSGLCAQDWYHKTGGGHGPGGVVLKPPFAWLELGFFSGDNERADPVQFRIIRSDARKDGSTSVDVSLSEWGLKPNSGPPEMRWDVAVRVVEEGGHPRVDDVTYLDADESLSGALNYECRAGHWVGRL